MDGKKLAVFDWNGTLLHDGYAANKGVNATLALFGFAPIDLDRFRACYDIPFSRYYENLGLKEDVIASKDPELVAKTFHNAYEEAVKEAPLSPDAAEILGLLKKAGVKRVILSNYLVPSIRHHLERLHALSLVDHILAYEDEKTQAQNAMIEKIGTKRLSKGDKLELYMQQTGFAPDQTVIFGDTPEETRIAHRLGFQSVAVSSGYATRARLEAEKPDLIIERLGEAEPFLRAKGFLA